MNLISKTNVFAEDKLFATLDTTVRKVVINTLPFLLTDTVGFIRKLPTQLIESFKSTLQEVKDADILLHIVDISHTSFEEHIDSVEKILHEINCHNKYSLMVFNKIDNYNNEDFIDKYDRSGFYPPEEKVNRESALRYIQQDANASNMNNIGYAGADGVKTS